MTEDGRLLLPPRPLDPGLYAQVKRTLTALDGKWDKKIGGFKFSHDAANRLADAINTGGAVHRVNTYQEFFTPVKLANKMAELVLSAWRFKDILTDTFRVLEPSAGKGALVDAMLGQYDFTQELAITAVEVQQHNLNSIVADLRVKKIKTNFLACATNVDTSTETDQTGYHAILMNPPFAKKTWVKHIEHALRFKLKSGVLVAVVPRTATLADLAAFVPPSVKAFLTPVAVDFEGTNIKVSIFTIGIHKSLVTAILGPITDKSATVQEPVKLKSPAFYLNQVHKSMKEIEAALSEVEAMLSNVGD